MKDYLISKGINEDKIFATGIPISSRFLINYNKVEIYKDFGLSSNIPTALFFAGGEFGLGKNRTLVIFETLIKNFDNLQVVAIAGRNKKIKNEFEEIVKEYNKENLVKVLEFTNKVPELMSISYFVISKPGGLTTSESLASNLPMLIINPIPGQEEENAKFLESKGIGIWIKKQDSIKNILNEIILNPNKLENMRNNTNLIAKKHSTENICKIILS